MRRGVPCARLPPNRRGRLRAPGATHGMQSRRKQARWPKGNGRRKRRRSRTRKCESGTATSSDVGRSVKTRAECGPTCESSNVRDAGNSKMRLESALMASMGTPALPAWQEPSGLITRDASCVWAWLAWTGFASKTPCHGADSAGYRGHSYHMRHPLTPYRPMPPEVSDYLPDQPCPSAVPLSAARFPCLPKHGAGLQLVNQVRPMSTFAFFQMTRSIATSCIVPGAAWHRPTSRPRCSLPSASGASLPCRWSGHSRNRRWRRRAAAGGTCPRASFRTPAGAGMPTSPARAPAVRLCYVTCGARSARHRLVR